MLEIENHKIITLSDLNENDLDTKRVKKLLDIGKNQKNEHCSLSGDRANIVYNLKQYDYLSDVEMAILTSSVIFDDDSEFINLLLDLNINYSELEKIVKNIKPLYYVFTDTVKLSSFNEEVKKNYKSLLSILSLCEAKYNCKEQYHVINKLMYIYRYKKNSYLKYQGAFDFDKIATIRDFKAIDEDKVNDLISRATTLYLYKRECTSDGYFSLYYATQNARNAANKICEGNLDFACRELVSTTYMFNDDETFIDLLLGMNISYDKLKICCTNLQAMKNLYDEEASFERNKREILSDITDLFTSVHSKVSKFLNCKDIYLTINKCMYIVAYKKEEYLKLQSQKKKIK